MISLLLSIELLGLTISMRNIPSTAFNPAIQTNERDALLAKAMASERAAIQAAESDPNRPIYHFRPPAFWMNDPNGTIYHDGWYHIFYQHNPYGPNWGHMHWGHARSRDLVNWEHLPIAIWPTISKGEDHIFSGSAIVAPDGRAKVFYTSISGKRAPEQWQAVADDADWIRWKKPEPNEVVTAKTHAPTDLQEWRDPFVFSERGRTYMLTGGQLDGKGTVALYRAQDADLNEWEYRGILFTHPNVDVIECPNLVKVGDRWVLFTSTYDRGKRFVVETFVGTLDLDRPEFKTERRGTIGEGFYASQLLQDKAGRPILFAWHRIEGNVAWNGCLSLPSVLSLAKDGSVRTNPIKAMETLREGGFSMRDQSIVDTLDLMPKVEGGALEVVADIDPGTARSLKLSLDQFDLGYDVASKTLTMTDRTPKAISGRRLRLHLFLDRSVLDLYAQNGALFQTAYRPMEGGRSGFRITAAGGKARIISLKVYPLRPTTFDLSRFK